MAYGLIWVINWGWSGGIFRLRPWRCLGGHVSNEGRILHSSKSRWRRTKTWAIRCLESHPKLQAGGILMDTLSLSLVDDDVGIFWYIQSFTMGPLSKWIDNNINTGAFYASQTHPNHSNPNNRPRILRAKAPLLLSPAIFVGQSQGVQGSGNHGRGMPWLCVSLNMFETQPTFLMSFSLPTIDDKYVRHADTKQDLSLNRQCFAPTPVWIMFEASKRRVPKTNKLILALLCFWCYPHVSSYLIKYIKQNNISPMDPVGR